METMSWSVAPPLLDSVSVLDVFTDQTRLPNCGTIFLSKARGKSPDSPVFIIPKPKKVSEESGEETVRITSETVVRVEHGKEGNYEVVCLVLHPTLGNIAGRQRKHVFFVMEEDQARTILKQVPGLFYNKTSLEKRESGGSTSDTMFSNVVSRMNMNKCCSNMQDPQCPESLFKDFITPYIYFTKQWPQKDRMKESLFNTKSLPLLLKRMKFDDRLIRRALCDFIRLHKCRAKSCPGFSSIKCSACKSVRYCDADCQELDFARHTKLCQKMKKEREKTFHVGQILQKELQARMEGQKIYSFEFFISNIHTRIFEAFSDHLTEVSLQVLILSDLEKHNIDHVDWNNLARLSTKRREVTYSRLVSQMVYHFGDENFLSEAVRRQESDVEVVQKNSRLTDFLELVQSSIKDPSYLQIGTALLFLTWFLVKSYKVLYLGLPFSSW